MPKAYIKDWKERPQQSSSGRTFYDVTFDQTPQSVKTLPNIELAENICRDFQDMNFDVKCETFGVEKLATNQFVIFCEYTPDSATYPPAERPTDSVETENYRGYTIELRYYKHPDSSLIPMHVYLNRGDSSTIVPFSQEMPIREFITKEDARRIGIVAAKREIDKLESAA